MPNITLSIDDAVIKKVLKIAIDKDTTLTAMVREFLISYAERNAQAGESYVEKPVRDLEKNNLPIKEYYSTSTLVFPLVVPYVELL